MPAAGGAGGGGGTLSATIEDSADASCAGQFSTFLGASGADQVVADVERCWSAALSRTWTPTGPSVRSPTAPTKSPWSCRNWSTLAPAGVLFTQHPRTGDRSLVVIEASYGLGESVVGGQVTPDLFEVNKVTRQIHQRTAGAKSTEYRVAGDARGVKQRPVPAELQTAWSISDDEVAALVAMAAELEAKLGRGLDVEWAFGSTRSDPGADTLFALQVRPITVGRQAQPGPVSGSAPIDIVLARLSGHETSAGAR